MSPAGPTAAARPSSRVVHAFLRNPLAVSGLALFGCTLLVAALAPALAPDTYDNQDIMGRLKPPLSRSPDGRVYLLGSDPLGRDMLEPHHLRRPGLRLGRPGRTRDRRRPRQPARPPRRLRGPRTRHARDAHRGRPAGLSLPVAGHRGDRGARHQPVDTTRRARASELGGACPHLAQRSPRDPRAGIGHRGARARRGADARGVQGDPSQCPGAPHRGRDARSSAP